jgi:tripartite-type tricarboxylate transporter receptor subunit TctC
MRPNQMLASRVAHTGLLVAASVLITAAGAVRAEDYPSRPVRIIVGFPAGWAGDLAARTVAARLSEGLGQQFVIDNKPGASSSIAAEGA